MLRTRISKKPFYYFIEKCINILGYFGDNSTLHGVRHVLSLSPIPFYKRLFWLLIVIASGVCASAILLQVLSLYSGGAISYLIETDYLEFDTPFPAVTICEQASSSASAERIKAYIHTHNDSLVPGHTNFLKDVTFWNAKFCKSCTTCTDKTCVEEFYSSAKAIRAKCKELLTDCWWDGKPFKCCERFMPLETEYGTCFVFNSRLTGNDTLTVNRKIGLPNLVFSAVEEVGIRVHSPDDIVFVGMENVLGKPVVLPLITDYEVILQVEETVSDQTVTAMQPKLRGCLLKDERPAYADGWPFKQYAFSICMLYCRASRQMELCNCTHHLMPKMGNRPLCDIQGLVCLFQNKDMLGSVSCDCPMSCEEITYKLVHAFFHRHTGKPTPKLASRGTRAQVKVAQLPTSRVRRTAIRTVMGLVVDIGGVGGVFFGASLLSVIEIVYLCCMRRKK